ncbi:MAG: hypothetical protein FJ104_12205 [Deltaproteobacteria bacterium]|nr:hypothetical protein [Deltaproteobacteria bacterium]
MDVSSGDAGLTRIGAVAAAAACSNVDDGWHYDDPIAPTKVLVCPQTCERVQAATGSQIDVVFGCATVDAEIK